VLTNKATVFIKGIGKDEKPTPESVETAVINASLENTMSINMAKQFD
jgi:hypothetical protein